MFQLKVLPDSVAGALIKCPAPWAVRTDQMRRPKILQTIMMNAIYVKSALFHSHRDW